MSGKYKVVPNLVRMKKDQPIVDVAKKIENFINSNVGKSGRFVGIEEVSVMVECDETGNKEIQQLSMWIFTE